MFSFPIIKTRLAWVIGFGKRVILGFDPFIGCNSSFKLSGPLIQHLNNLNIFYITHTSIPIKTRSNQRWFESIHLGLTGGMKTEWDEFVTILRSSGI